MGDYELQWARAFALTLGVEVPLYFWLLVKQGLPAHSALGAAVFANAVSHPLLWFAMPRFEPYAAFAVTAEMLVLAVESAIVMAWCAAFKPKLRWRAAVGIAVVANAASVVAGLLL